MRRSYGQDLKPVPPARLQTNLMALLFERLRVDKQLLVLDMGPASGATVRLFNQFRCKLKFLDLCGDDFALDENASHQEMVDYFRSLLDLNAGTKIDIILFWDLFNYLQPAALTAFNEALEPHVDNSTRGHCLGVLSSRNGLPFYQYGIDNLTSLTQTDRCGVQPLVYPHSLRDLSSLLDYFEIDKSRLMQDGRIEYLLFENRNPNPSSAQFL